jgi:hypothetical protein
LRVTSTDADTVGYVQRCSVLVKPVGGYWTRPRRTEDVVPKSKVRKKPTVQVSRSASAAAAAAGPRARAIGPSGPVYVGIMLGLMLLGLAWLVVYYLWGQDLGFMTSVGNWNFGIGFALMIAGLLMTMRWR